jgi:hypothetical protein
MMLYELINHTHDVWREMLPAHWPTLRPALAAKVAAPESGAVIARGECEY